MTVSPLSSSCPECGFASLRLLTGHLYHCERCRYTAHAPAPELDPRGAAA